MRIQRILLLLVATTFVSSSPVGLRGRYVLVRNEESQTGNSTDVLGPSGGSSPSTTQAIQGSAPTSLTSSRGQVGIVPAIPNNPGLSPPLTFPQSVCSPSPTPTALRSSRSSNRPLSGAKQTAGSVTSRLISNATSSGILQATGGGNMVGIVPAIPNDPANSPPMTAIPSIPAARLSSASAAALASATAAQSNSGVLISTLVVNATGAGILSAAATKTTSIPSRSTSASNFAGVTSTTFPLIGDAPAQGSSSSVSSSTPITPQKTFSILVTGSPSTAISNSTVPTTFVTQTIVRSNTVTALGGAATPLAVVPASTSTLRNESNHHGHTSCRPHHSHARSNATAPTQLFGGRSTTSIALLVPNLSTLNLSSLKSTITVPMPTQPLAQVNSASTGLTVVPVTPNAALGAVTVTVTATIAESTQTVTTTTTTIAP